MNVKKMDEWHETKKAAQPLNYKQRGRWTLRTQKAARPLSGGAAGETRFGSMILVVESLYTETQRARPSGRPALGRAPPHLGGCLESVLRKSWTLSSNIG